MNITTTHIEGLLIIDPVVLRDDRGSFLESFHLERFREAAGDVDFVQDNLSVSAKDVIRGLHYQLPPHAQGKLVSVAYGAVLDVAVDLRKESPTYGKYVSVELSAQNRRQFWIPPGFAHGFAVLEPETVFTYKCTSYYHRESDRVLLWNDPDLNIDWKINTPVLSEKDKMGVPFRLIEPAF